MKQKERIPQSECNANTPFLHKRFQIKEGVNTVNATSVGLVNRSEYTRGGGRGGAREIEDGEGKGVLRGVNSLSLYLQYSVSSTTENAFTTKDPQAQGERWGI